MQCPNFQMITTNNTIPTVIASNSWYRFQLAAPPALFVSSFAWYKGHPTKEQFFKISLYRSFLTLRRDRGGQVAPPWTNILKYSKSARRRRAKFSFSYWNLLLHILPQIPVLSVPPVATGVSPAICGWLPAGQYLNLKNAPNLMKIGTQIIFGTRNTMELFIFDKNQFLIPKKRFLYFRPNKRMATCRPPVTVVGPVWVSIIFYYQGWLLVQRASLGDFPFLRS